VLQCDRRDRYTRRLARRNHFGLELVAVASPATALRRSVFLVSVHVSAYLP
jgi:hypothetical protein